MKNNYIKRFARFFIGITCCAVGILFTLQANIGFSPWDVLHMGISGTTGISYGTANIGVGISILLLAVILGEKLGLGTVLNILCVGKIVDFLLRLNILPNNANENVIIGLVMMTLGLSITAFGCVLYLGAELGGGPRDSMMVGLKKKFPKVPVGAFKGILEGSALVGGYILGGKVGVGTLYAVVASGFIVQTIFGVCKFQVDKLEQESIIETFKNFVGKGQGFTTEIFEEAPAPVQGNEQTAAESQTIEAPMQNTGTEPQPEPAEDTAPQKEEQTV